VSVTTLLSTGPGGLYECNSSDEQTTLRELSAMAAPAQAKMAQKCPIGALYTTLSTGTVEAVQTENLRVELGTPRWRRCSDGTW